MKHYSQACNVVKCTRANKAITTASCSIIHLTCNSITAPPSYYFVSRKSVTAVKFVPSGKFSQKGTSMTAKIFHCFFKGNEQRLQRIRFCTQQSLSQKSMCKIGNSQVPVSASIINKRPGTRFTQNPEDDIQKYMPCYQKMQLHTHFSTYTYFFHVSTTSSKTT